MSEYLKDFLQSYLDWVILGAPETEMDNQNNFNRAYGLCDNLNDYLWNVQETKECLTRREIWELRDDFEELFIEDGLNSSYPFGEDDFHIESELRTHHMNPNRINWIRKQLEK